MGLHFVVQPWPEELIYSVASRTLAIFGFPHGRDISRALFGNPRLQVDLGIGLQRTSPKLFVDSALDKTTLTAFLTSFVAPPHKREQIKECIASGDHVSVAYLLGRAGARRRANEFLRFCPDCAAEQKQIYGEPYWTRLPQIRGVEVCPRHRRHFLEGSVRRHHPECYRTLVTEWNRPYTLPKAAAENDSLIDLAIAAEALLEFDAPWTPTDLDHAWELVLDQLNIGRYVRGSATRIAKGLLEKYGAKYLASADCSPNVGSNDSWIAHFLRKPSSEPDPLRHLLVLRLYNISVSSLKSARKTALASSLRDFGPFTCQTTVCPSYKTPAFCDARPFRHPYTRNKAVEITCGCCGGVVTRVLSSRAPTVFSEYVHRRGARWEYELRKSWIDSSLSIRGIAHTLGCDSMTVKRHALRLRLPFPRSGPRTASVVPASRQPRTPIGQTEVLRHRQMWVAALKGAKSVKRARGSANAAYAWLYRHDRAWLQESCGQGQHVERVPVAQINWKEREKVLIPRLDSAVSKIVVQSPFQRLTLTAVLRDMGATKHRQQLHLMPKLLNRLAMLTNSNIL